MGKLIARAAIAALAVLLTSTSGWAASVTIKGTPPVSVNIPAGFSASDIERGVQLKTSDDEVFVWLETYTPDQKDTLLAEHDKYWTEQGVDLGNPATYVDDKGAIKVAALGFNSAKWKGKPTVVRYLFINAGFSSKEMILMSLWASPEGDKAQDAAIDAMIRSMDAKE